MMAVIAGFLVIVKKHGFSSYPTIKLSRSEVGEYSRKFCEYSIPLYSLVFVGIFADIGGRWLLQKFCGSTEQGYFSLSNTVSSFVIMFSGSLIAPLLLREFSIAMGRNDLTRISSLFQRVVPMFYSLAAYMSIFIAYHAKTVVLTLGDVDFNKATIPVVIMSFYPIHYSTNNLAHALLHSTRNAKTLRNVGISVRVLALVFSFFVVAPKKYLG